MDDRSAADQAHQVAPAGDGPDDEAVGHRLGERRQVRRDAEQLLGAAGSGPEAGHDLVEDQDHAVAGAHLAEALEEAGRGPDVAAPERLGHDRRDATAGEPRLDRVEVVPGQHLGVLDGGRVLAGRRGAQTLVAARRHVGPAGQADEHAVEPAVVVALELDDRVVAGGAPGRSGTPAGPPRCPCWRSGPSRRTARSRSRGGRRCTRRRSRRRAGRRGPAGASRPRSRPARRGPG